MDMDPEVEDIFEIGDPVRLKNRILADKKHKLMGPRRLISQGWPNHFYVERVGTSEGIPVVSLSACCYNLENRQGAFQCKAHPISFFEKIKPEVAGEGRPKRKGDRTASITTPLGKFVDAEYSDDADNPGLILNILGKKFGANGMWIKHFVDLAKEKGLL